MQVERAYRQYCSRADALAKNTFMTSLKEQNEVLYYKVFVLVYLLSHFWSVEILFLRLLQDTDHSRLCASLS